MIGKRPSIPVVVCTALVLAGGITAAAAQDFLSPKPIIQHPAVQARPPSPASPSQVSPSQAAVGAAAVKPDLSEEIGDWRLLCFTKPGRTCELEQRRVNTSNQALLIWVELSRLLTPKPAWQLTVMVPLGFRVVTNLGVSADGALLLNLPVVTCVPAGCVYAAELPTDGLDTLQKAQTVGTEIVDLKGQRFALGITMRGFKDAYLKSALFLKAS